jgi:hypothetical protein
MGRHSFNTLVCVLFVWISVLSISCAKESGANVEAETAAIDEAQYWIDQNDPDRAIAILSPMLTETPVSAEQERVRLVLASAYVSRSGVDLAKLVQALKRVRKFSAQVGGTLSDVESKVIRYINANPKLGANKETILIVQQAYRGILTVIETIELLEQLPLAIPERQPDLKYAIGLLQTNSETFSSGAYLYRGILKFIDLQMNIRARVYFRNLRLCQLSQETFFFNLKILEADFVGVLQDLEVGLSQPKDQTKIKNFRVKAQTELQKVYDQPLNEQELFEIERMLQILLNEEDTLCS